MLQKFTFYDDPLSEMETLDSVDSIDIDDELLGDSAGEEMPLDVAPKKRVKQSSNRGTCKKRTRPSSRAA